VRQPSSPMLEFSCFAEVCTVTDSMKAPAPDADWLANPRWEGIVRAFTANDTDRLRGSVHVEHTVARPRAERLWKLLHEENFDLGLGSVTGNQATGSKERAAGCSAA
jgi:isocitrate lyase